MPFVVPVVAAAGDNAVVAWLAEGNVATARVTTDGGDNWSDEAAVGEGLSAAAARVGRLAIAGTREGGIAWVRVWNDGTWGDVQDVPQVMFGAETASAVEVDVVLRSENRIGVAYSAQLDVDEETADTWEEIHWFQSADEGDTWGAGQRVSRQGSETAAFNAARPTALWLDERQALDRLGSGEVLRSGRRLLRDPRTILIRASSCTGSSPAVTPGSTLSRAPYRPS